MAKALQRRWYDAETARNRPRRCPHSKRRPVPEARDSGTAPFDAEGIRSLLLALARRCLGPDQDLEDFVEDTLLVLVEAAAWPHPCRCYPALGATVLYRKMASRWRVHAARTRLLPLESLATMAAPSLRRPFDWPARILTALDDAGLQGRLTRLQREVYRLSRENRELREIAGILGHRQQSVRKAYQGLVKKARALVLAHAALAELYERERERERE
jgi:DNA-directed RNA polymerase specialized sigma24 family protein